MTATVSSPVKGILWMMVTGLCFVGVTAFVKLLGGRIPAAESAFLRYALGLVFLIPAWRSLIGMRLTRRQAGLVGLRGVTHAGGVICWFFAMTRIPIAEVTAMNYLTPVLVTIMAVIFLRETLALRRIMAIVVALGGVLLILRPGFRELDPGHFAMIGTATAFSVSYLIAKIISSEMSAALVVSLMSVTVMIALLPFALVVWVPPSLTDLAILFAVACFATGGHYAMTRAFVAAPVTVTQPVTFLQLVWSVLVGAVFFAEPVDIWVVAGGSIIMGAVLFMTWREAVLKRRISPAGPEAQL